jgi:hypothetical protein
MQAEIKGERIGQDQGATAHEELVDRDALNDILG